MPFQLPPYQPPDFRLPALTQAPVTVFQPAPADGVAPENYHATSVYPEYFQIRPGEWRLLEQSRMDCVVVQRPEGALEVTEFRRLKGGDRVAIGRREDGEDGILVHTAGFALPGHSLEKFAFRSMLTRETSFSIDYDELYQLLLHEREQGFVVWVLGPAVVFDRDARRAFGDLIRQGYVQALLAGNALATHDLEASFFGTALGQEIYSKHPVALGHYKHLDALNRVRRMGSMKAALEEAGISDGVMAALLQHGVPFVLAGSIRDDGPLPEVEADAYAAQDRMRAIARQATTVIALATQLHTIAVGNMVPSYTLTPARDVRPVYFYTVDMSEFAINKLANRGSLTARSILTNVQDFVVTVERGLRRRAAAL